MSKKFSHSDIEPSRLLAIAKPLLDYDHQTGIFTWKVAFREGDEGRPAGMTDRNGYVAIRLLDETFFAHRLAWLFYYGQWPHQYVDHINGDKADNRIANLRDVSQSENMANRQRPRRDNPGLPMGCQRKGGKFSSKIRVNGQQIYLGTFDSAEDAGAAFDAAVIQYRSPYAATNKKLGLIA